jgi:hypothetical protein
MIRTQCAAVVQSADKNASRKTHLASDLKRGARYGVRELVLATSCFLLAVASPAAREAVCEE